MTDGRDGRRRSVDHRHNTTPLKQISAATGLYANVSYQTRFDGDAVAYNGKAGIRITW